MITRLALLLALLIPLSGHRRSAGRENALAHRALIGQAALRFGRAPQERVLGWLREQPGVASAGLGRDGKTVDLRFFDGSEAAILPRIPVESAIRPASHATVVRPHLQVPGGRALVLEPFATELGLGSRAGEAEAVSLRSAGFAVDQAYDGQVDVALMRTLAQYNVVYILTHSGVNPEGEGVIATGQLANSDPSVQPLLDDHTVMIVGVVGTPDMFYGLLSGYFREHASPFPLDSLWFINGCSMLKGSLVWHALASLNVRAMVSWDDEAMQNEDAVSAQLFFQSLAAGKTVSQAIADVVAAGHGRSVVGTTAGQLGYLGDGAFTLRDVLTQPTPTITPTPTDTSTPLPTPTATASPTATPFVHRPWPAPIAWKTVIHVHRS